MNISTVFEPEIKKILKTYKIPEKDLLILLEKQLNANTNMQKVLETNPEGATRTRVFKDFLKILKKDVYYKLRTYKPDANQKSPLETHISTKERLAYKSDWDKFLIDKFGNVETILDIGGGVFPLMFPFESFLNLSEYVWIDKDKWAYEELQKLNQKSLVLHNLDFSETNSEWFKQNYGTFDVAILMKVVSVVQRQEIELMQILEQLPAKQLLITATKEAMTKHLDVSHKENKRLLKFIQSSGRKIVEKFEIGNEFGYILT